MSENVCERQKDDELNIEHSTQAGVHPEIIGLFFWLKLNFNINTFWVKHKKKRKNKPVYK